jgi:hypothetical protein
MAAGNKGRQGGAQPGAGRKKRVDEEWSRKMCIAGLIKKYGSIEEGIETVLSEFGDSKVKLLIWQHVLGVPETISKVKLSDSKGNKLEGGLTPGIITVNVVRTVHNKDVVVGDKKEGE